MYGHRFFRETEFLSLVRLWEAQRRDGRIAVWEDDFFDVASTLLDNVIIADARPALSYRYVGRECVARWGGDPTGHRIADTLQGEYLRYIDSLLTETLERGVPVFSSAVLQAGDDLVLSGRLLAPFARPGETEASLVVGLHFFQGPDMQLRSVGPNGFARELDRLMIVAAPEFCERLERAGRFTRAAALLHQPEQAGRLDRRARELVGDTIQRLDCVSMPDAGGPLG